LSSFWVLIRFGTGYLADSETAWVYTCDEQQRTLAMEGSSEGVLGKGIAQFANWQVAI
jgi:hypothetical protein